MDVINDFKKNSIKNSNKIKNLKNFSNIDWNELKNQDRVKDIKNAILKIIRTQ